MGKLGVTWRMLRGLGMARNDLSGLGEARMLLRGLGMARWMQGRLREGWGRLGRHYTTACRNVRRYTGLSHS